MQQSQVLKPKTQGSQVSTRGMQYFLTTWQSSWRISYRDKAFKGTGDQVFHSSTNLPKSLTLCIGKKTIVWTICQKSWKNKTTESLGKQQNMSSLPLIAIPVFKGDRISFFYESFRAWKWGDNRQQQRQTSLFRALNNRPTTRTGRKLPVHAIRQKICGGEKTKLLEKTCW